MAEPVRKSAMAVYEEMVAIIDQAATEKHIYLVPEAAERQGLSGGEIQRDLSQRWANNYADDAGGTVKVECYWYDQSKPFQIKPDKHVMKVELQNAEGRLSHVKSYEE